MMSIPSSGISKTAIFSRTEIIPFAMAKHNRFERFEWYCFLNRQRFIFDDGMWLRAWVGGACAHRIGTGKISYSIGWWFNMCGFKVYCIPCMHVFGVFGVRGMRMCYMHRLSQAYYICVQRHSSLLWKHADDQFFKCND